MDFHVGTWWPIFGNFGQIAFIFRLFVAPQYILQSVWLFDMLLYVFITTQKRYLEFIVYHYTLMHTVGLYEAMQRFGHICDMFLECDN